jgi:hypothetical protein
MTIKPVGSVSAAKNVVSDDKLTWDQIQTAQVTLTEHMGKQGWPQDYICTLIKFFINFNFHPS